MHRLLYLYLYIILFLLFFGLVTIPVFAVDKNNEIESPKQHFKIHLDQVVISTPMQDRISNAAKPVNILYDEELQLKVAGTMGETLKQELGIYGQSYGPGVGLPVIRGQSGPRVQILRTGLGINDASQVSHEHASGSVSLLAERIEILRRPTILIGD